MSAILSRGSVLDSLTTAPTASKRARDLAAPMSAPSQARIENLLQIVNELPVNQLETLSQTQLRKLLLTLYWRGLIDEETLLSYQYNCIDSSFLQNRITDLRLELQRRLDINKENDSMTQFLKVNFAVILAILTFCGVQNAYWREGNLINQVFNKGDLIDLQVGEPWSSAYGHVFVPTFESGRE